MIAIIAILASMLLPSLHEAMRQAKRAKCVNFLAQAGTAAFLYVSDNNEWLWPYDQRCYGTTYWWYNASEFAPLWPYLKFKNGNFGTANATSRCTFSCPEWSGTADGGIYGYGMNALINSSSGKASVPTSTVAFYAPHKTCLIADAAVPSGSGALVTPENYQRFSHKGASSFLFCDGRAEALTRQKVPYYKTNTKNYNVIFWAPVRGKEMYNCKYTEEIF